MVNTFIFSRGEKIVYFGQRKHWSPRLRKNNKFQEGKKCIFLDPPAGFQEERYKSAYQQQVLPIEVCLRDATWEMYYLPRKKIFAKMANKDKQSLWSNMRAEITALLSHHLSLAPAVVLISLLTSLMWRKLTDIAKELRGTETRRKTCFSNETVVNQLTTTVKFYACYHLPFSMSFVNLCFAFHMVRFYKCFHLNLILHSKL